MEPHSRKRSFSFGRDSPYPRKKKWKHHNVVSAREGNDHRLSPWRRHGRKRRDDLSDRKRETPVWTGRGRRDKRGGWKRGATRGRGRGRNNETVWISDDQFYSKPTDAAIACGMDDSELRKRLEQQGMIQVLHEICQSPNKYCVRNVFETLYNVKFFERNDVLVRIEKMLENQENQATDGANINVSLIGSITKSYWTFLNSTKRVDKGFEMLLSRCEPHFNHLHSMHPQSLDDFGCFRSPVDCHLDLVLQPGMAALYDNVRLEKRKITDPYENVHSLLERIFYLYKEDVTRPLIRGLRRLRYFLKTNNDPEKFRDDDIRVYRDSKFLCSVASISDGLVWELQLDTSQPLVKSIMNRHRCILQCGTLICMSKDVFKKNIVYGTVVDSQNKDDLTKNGIVSIEFQQSFNPGEAQDFFTLVESKSNCFAHIGALVALKVKLEKDEQLPFEKQIVYHQQSYDPPDYLTSELSVGKRVSFDCLRNKLDTDNGIDDNRVIKDIIEQMVLNVCADISSVNLPTWPSPEDVGMDISQYRAFSDGLMQGLALIQGPPGTGKTVIALKMLEILLNNENIWCKINVGPIILLSYTNHALDQFLEGIVRMPKMYAVSNKDIVRVGSRSKTESLDKFNLRHRRKESKTKTRQNALTALHAAAKEHFEISHAIKTYQTSLVHENFLYEVDVIPYHLFMSLREPNLTSLPADGTYLCGWLEIFFDDFVPHHGVDDEYVKATEELDTEEIPENDRLRLGFDQEDVKFELSGKVDIGTSKMLNPTSIVTTETEKDKEKGIRYWTFVENEKTAILQEVKRRIMRTRPMSPEEENNIKHVRDLSRNDRWRLYALWIHRILRTLKEDVITAQETYRNAYGRYKECRHSEDIIILKNARIVAMTTTRAATDHEILRKIDSKIMVIEEAAEVPDHHLLACLVPSLQHLVLIGDHQQLRPAYNDYKTAMRYDLNVSIFERLVTAGLPFQQLQFQHRMRPEIADLLTPTIYRELKNHSSVLEIEDVKGLQNNVFFLNHNEKEHANSNQDVKSHKNQHEVDFIAQFYRYLRLQGYRSEDITVLTTYKEQERLLKIAIRDIEKKEKFLSRLLKPQDRYSKYESSDSYTGNRHYTDANHIIASQESNDSCKTNDQNVGNARVTTVDNYQGEENKIILLSLVRSNANGTIGFLREPNRICVALSRAKAGLYIIGDCELLREKNVLWSQIIQKAESRGWLGTSLALCCRNHPHIKTMASKASDFKKVPNGGCSLKCSIERTCGHVCPRMCHIDDPDHNRRLCISKCEKPCSSGHKCQSECNKCLKECQPCKFKVLKTLPKCRHTVSVHCYKKPEECECTERCTNILECGHQCQKRCGIACNTLEDCNELVQVSADCGHTIQTACHTKHNPVCKVKCSAKLQCGHVCKGTCHSCFAGHLHQKCREKIQHKLTCGHTLTTDCVSASWDKKNNGVLFKCQSKCQWGCDHEACTKKCNEPCTRQFCNVRCTEHVRCGHVCELLKCDHNGDHWCRKCSRQTINVRLRRTRVKVRNPHHIRLLLCGCIFETETLDKHLALQDGKSLDGPRCPNCQREINDMRYYKYIHNAQRARSSANLDTGDNSPTQELSKLWNGLGYKDFSKLISNHLQNCQTTVRDRSETLIDLLTEQTERISVCAKAQTNDQNNESTRWRCAYTIDRLSGRLRRYRPVLSFQEVEELPLLISKLISSLKCFIFRVTASERMSEKMFSSLNASENIYSSSFIRSAESVQKLDPALFYEVSRLVTTLLAPRNNGADHSTSSPPCDVSPVRNDSDVDLETKEKESG